MMNEIGICSAAEIKIKFQRIPNHVLMISLVLVVAVKRFQPIPSQFLCFMLSGHLIVQLWPLLTLAYFSRIITIISIII